jgi:hypothetical protein
VVQRNQNQVIVIATEGGLLDKQAILYRANRDPLNSRADLNLVLVTHAYTLHKHLEKVPPQAGGVPGFSLIKLAAGFG